ncbi:MAG: hypothetical protein E7Z69_05595 [Thermoplasmata archaeon]|nr:hypothetical protein [Thermoplasmata archaeon]
MDVGARAGCLAFHPWRQAEDYWEFSPHFHSLLFGFLDTDRFRQMNPGWIIKKVHADQAVESIGQTAAYLMTHMGLGMVERDPLEVDYDLRFLAHMLPGLSDDCNRNGKADEREFRFSEQDDIDRASGKGRMVGDISRIDWLEFAKKSPSYTTRMTYFGAASNRNIQTVAVEREYRNRVCRACGNPLSVYAGICDGCGEPARYLYDNTIKVFRSDRDFVKRALDELRNADPENMPKLSEISPKVSLMVSKDETAFDRLVPRKADLPCNERPPARVRIRRTGDEEPPF